MSRLQDERAWLLEVMLVVGLAVGAAVGVLIALTSVPFLTLLGCGLVVWLVGSVVILVSAG